MQQNELKKGDSAAIKIDPDYISISWQQSGVLATRNVMRFSIITI